MPMNEQPPWGQKKKPSGPEDVLAQLIQKIRDTFSGKEEGRPQGGSEGPSPVQPAGFLPGAGKLLAIVAAVLLLQGAFSCFYTIKPGEVGVVLRFGQYTRTTQPGLHFKIPYVEDLAKVDVESVRKEEFGFRTRTPGISTTFERKGYDMESLMLTGDKDVIEVAWIVQYKVSDPVNFLFKVRDVAQTVRDASETVTRRIVGNMDFDYVLGNREILAANAKQELQAQMDRLQCGINVVTVQLLDINPPEQVKPAFNEVNEADQDMKRLVNEAEETYNKVIPKARGSAKQIVEEARGYAVERTNRANGETHRFKAVVKEYEGAESVTRQRLYLEAMEEILPQVEHIYVMDRSQQSILPLFDVTRKASPAQPSDTAR
ncbi:protease FtsH subunit HflK [Desulfobulbus propionicus DSM 2032]|jgi:membrane protease subunit HflK|uniref:Protein HflK n=1 Tax=Desulfobulbus propionicus (strain ATCC 33891 / DSM 2032 / VKM B-1956 / 1pr3) TaxID=577650 RepID=A0A7U4DNC4_DESPD|nr:FtsH protease activity modulator HflK [Desulfobulbus propionicus]ADW16916.1 protease FtsH subunit HflK [Desulfobulbus propionicus DSM 2032]